MTLGQRIFLLTFMLVSALIAADVADAAMTWANTSLAFSIEWNDSVYSEICNEKLR